MLRLNARPAVLVVSALLICGVSGQGTTLPSAQAQGAPATAAKSPMPKLAPELKGRWERQIPGGRTIGNVTAIRITKQDQTAGKASGTFEYWTAGQTYTGLCATVTDSPLEMTWEGDKNVFRLVTTDALCGERIFILKAGKVHFLEGEDEKEPARKVYYD